MRRILKIFDIKGKSTRIPFIVITLITILFILMGLCFIISNLFAGINFKIINIHIKLYGIVSIILIYLWFVIGIKRCRDLGLPIYIFFIPIILLIISIICVNSFKLEYYFLYGISFILQFILIIILSIFKGR